MDSHNYMKDSRYHTSSDRSSYYVDSHDYGDDSGSSCYNSHDSSDDSGSSYGDFYGSGSDVESSYGGFYDSDSGGIGKMVEIAEIGVKEEIVAIAVTAGMVVTGYEFN